MFFFTKTITELILTFSLSVINMIEMSHDRTVKNFQNSCSQESCIQSRQLHTVKRVAYSQESFILSRALHTVKRVTDSQGSCRLTRQQQTVTDCFTPLQTCPFLSLQFDRQWLTEWMAPTPWFAFQAQAIENICKNIFFSYVDQGFG